MQFEKKIIRETFYYTFQDQIKTIINNITKV